MSEVKSNKAWRLECESLRAKVEALRALLLDARDRASAFGMVDLPQDIDAALAAKEWT